MFKIKECFIVWNEFYNSKLKSWFNIENTFEKFNLDDPMIEYLEDHRIDHVFYDAVADYMEGFFSLCFLLCLHLVQAQSSYALILEAT